MRYLHFLSLAALLTFTAACGEDPFSTTVELDIPEHEPLPVLSVDLRSGDSVLYAAVGFSYGILDNPVIPVTQPILTLRKGEELLLQQPVDQLSVIRGGISLPLPDRIADEPGTYTASLEYPGFEVVTATQQMPPPPVVSNVSYEADGTINQEGYIADEIEFDLQDNPATKDYYGVSLRGLRYNYNVEFDTVTGDFNVIDSTLVSDGGGFYILSPDPLLREGANYSVVFTDEGLPTGPYRVRLSVERYNDNEIELLVGRITEDAYRYAVSKTAFVNAGDNPFAEPVNVHTNVENGYGQFLMGNVLTFPLRE